MTEVTITKYILKIWLRFSDVSSKKRRVKTRLFTVAGLYVLFKTEFTDKSKYYVDAGKNSVYLKKYDCRYLHFEEKTERKQTITGVVYNVDSFKETENLIDEFFIGINYEISILNTENSITTVKKN